MHPIRSHGTRDQSFSVETSYIRPTRSRVFATPEVSKTCNSRGRQAPTQQQAHAGTFSNSTLPRVNKYPALDSGVPGRAAASLPSYIKSRHVRSTGLLQISLCARGQLHNLIPPPYVPVSLAYPALCSWSGFVHASLRPTLQLDPGWAPGLQRPGCLPQR